MDAMEVSPHIPAHTKHGSLDLSHPQLPSNKRLTDILQGMETGWFAHRRDRAAAMRRAENYMEEDVIVNGNVAEKSCQLPPDVRCTIAVAASSDGTLFATSHGDHAIRIFSMVTGKTVAVLEGHARTPWTLSFHRLHSHLLVSGCLNGELRLWDVRERRCIKSAVLGPDRVTSVAFHPEEQKVAAACGRDLHFWDVTSPNPPQKVLETTIGFLCLYFHPNGNWLLTCEVRSLGTNGAGAQGAQPVHTPHFCIRLRDLNDNLSPFNSFHPHDRDTDLLPMVLVYSESGTCISPCGKYLAVCLPPLGGEGEASEQRQVHDVQDIASGGHPTSNNPQDDPMAGGEGDNTFPLAYRHGYIAIISLVRSTFTKVLCTAPIPKAAKITCIRFSSSCQYLLVGYGGRDMRPNTAGERLRRGLELYRFVQKVATTATGHSLHLVRDLTMSNDVLNAAEWQPILGGGILYGTDTGRTVSLTFTRGVEREMDEAGRGSPNVSDETTRLWTPGVLQNAMEISNPGAQAQASTPSVPSPLIPQPQRPPAPQPLQAQMPPPPAGVWGRPRQFN